MKDETIECSGASSERRNEREGGGGEEKEGVDVYVCGCAGASHPVCMAIRLLEDRREGEGEDECER